MQNEILAESETKGDMLWFIGLSDQGGRPVAPFFIVVDERTLQGVI